MTGKTYYNEFDPMAAAWLRELIKAGLIPDGQVDTRSITDVRASDLIGFDQHHFFAGIGGWPRALQIAGWPDDKPVWSSSLPCQPWSPAGKQAGAEDERHLWPVFFDLVRQFRPEHIVGEQVRNAIGLGWIDGVHADVAREGYAFGFSVLGAHSVGAPHIRQRIFWAAERLGDAVDGVAQSEHAVGRPEHALNRDAHGRHGLGGSRDDGRLADAMRSGWPEGRPESGGGSVTGNGATIRLGDTDIAGSQGRRLDAGEYAGQCTAGETGATCPQCGGRGYIPDPWPESESGWGCAACNCTGGVALPDGGLPGDGGLQRSGEYGRIEEDGGSGSGLADADGGTRQPGEPRDAERSIPAPDGRNTFWSNFTLIPCTDGKARRTERPFEQMASRLPAGVVRCGSEGAPGAEAGEIGGEAGRETFPLIKGQEARIMRLRGYGNSVVAPLAAEFIKAFMETLP